MLSGGRFFSLNFPKGFFCARTGESGSCHTPAGKSQISMYQPWWVDVGGNWPATRHHSRHYGCCKRLARRLGAFEVYLLAPEPGAMAQPGAPSGGAGCCDRWWLKIKPEGLRRCWPLFPLTRFHFGTGFLSHSQVEASIC